jgi:hypothetical protein
MTAKKPSQFEAQCTPEARQIKLEKSKNQPKGSGIKIEMIQQRPVYDQRNQINVQENSIPRIKGNRASRRHKGKKRVSRVRAQSKTHTEKSCFTKLRLAWQ